jgi:integrase
MLKDYKSYTLHTRKPKSGKPIYYAQFRLPDGTRTNAKSTGQTNKVAAERWCEAQLSKGQIVRKNQTLKDFSQGFFDWNGEYSTNRRATNKRFSERQSKELNAILENKIIPDLGSYPLTNLTKSVITEYRNKLFHDNLSGEYINRILSVIDRILVSAEEKGLISSIPRIEKVAKSPKTKGVLTQKELTALFKEEWNDPRAKAANLLALTTGLRQGEIMALRRSDFFQLVEDGDSFVETPVDWKRPQYTKGIIIRIRQSWNQKMQYMNETTKTGREVIAYPPKITFSIIAELVHFAESIGITGEDAFIFFAAKKDVIKDTLKKSEYSDTRPCDSKIFTDGLYKALDKIKIDATERVKRNIVFHSHRVMFNSALINGGVPVIKVQSLTGHSTMKMTGQIYYRPGDMGDVHDIMEKMLTDKKDKKPRERSKPAKS